MSYEINGVSPGLDSGKPLPRNEARTVRSNPDSERRPEAAPAVNALRGDDPAMSGQALEALAERAAKELDAAAPFFRPDLEFKVDDASGRTVITVYHPETEEVIRQIPPEEALQLAQILRESRENGDFSEISLIQAKV